MVKMDRENWITGHDWVLDKKQWPQQRELKCTKSAHRRNQLSHSGWDALLEKNAHRHVSRVTACMLRFITNKVKRTRLKRTSGPTITEKIIKARNYCVMRVQSADQARLQSPGWKLLQDEHTGLFKCEGRIKGYGPTYPPQGSFAEVLIVHVHNQTMHFGVEVPWQVYERVDGYRS